MCKLLSDDHKGFNQVRHNAAYALHFIKNCDSLCMEKKISLTLVLVDSKLRIHPGHHH